MVKKCFLFNWATVESFVFKYLLGELQNLMIQPYLLTTYYSLLHSHICCELLLRGHTAVIQRLLVLKIAATRIVTSSGHFDHCRPLYRDLNVPTGEPITIDIKEHELTREQL